MIHTNVKLDWKTSFEKAYINSFPLKCQDTCTWRLWYSEIFKYDNEKKLV